MANPNQRVTAAHYDAFRNPVGVAEAGHEAYRAKRPIWTNPFTQESAAEWRRGYLAAQLANGGVVYDDLPRRTRPARVIKRKRKKGAPLFVKKKAAH